MDRDLVRRVISVFPKDHFSLGYMEVFGGNCEVLLSKGCGRFEVHNDVSEVVVNLFKCLQSPVETVRMLSSGYGDSDGGLCRVANSLGVMREYFSSDSFCVGYSEAMLGVRESFGLPVDVLDLVDRLRSVQYEFLGFGEFIRKYDSPDAFFYVDVFLSEGLGVQDYFDLSVLLNGVCGKVLICYYYYDRLREWYPEDKWYYYVLDNSRRLLDCDVRVVLVSNYAV